MNILKEYYPKIIETDIISINVMDIKMKGY